jgi:hypothetical protein
MTEFLGSDDLGKELARCFNLTPITYLEHTGCRKFLDHPANDGCAYEPHPILGLMCLKAIKEPSPATGSGRAYDEAEIDYFWTQVATNLDALPSKFHQAIRNRQASVSVQKAVMRVVGRAGVFTLTGRLRANASYCARHNSVFQGLAADGAKLGLWHLWRAGFRIVNFIHDEVLVEVPAKSNLAHQAEIIRHLMVKGMKEVVPDIRVDVEYAASERWYKKAKVVLDQHGKLIPWLPTTA